jgi:DNA processing protein
MGPSTPRKSSGAAHPKHPRDSDSNEFGTNPVGSMRVSELPLKPSDLLGPLSELERRFAPSLLFVSGLLQSPLPHPRVSIVGTRSPSDEGREAAHRIASELASQGVTIVSGLADGVDTAAHTGAISVAGQTIAVLGTPLSQVYPAKNRDLQHLIMENHLAVSQFPDGHPVRPGNFVMRNRVMALMSDATVIVESGERGGSLHQGWEAIRLGRPLFIRHPVMSDKRLLWPREMQKYGAVEFQDSGDILDFVPTSRSELTVDGIG